MKLNEEKNEKEYNECKEYETPRYNVFASVRNIYKYNRMVIGIAPKEDFYEEILDDSPNSYHVTATIEIAKKLGVKLNKTISPYEAGLEASQNNLVIMQFLGNECMLYLPETITKFQQTMILYELSNRENFTFSYAHNGKTIDGVELNDIYILLDYITTSRKK